MDKVGVLVKLFLNVIRFLCENGNGAVKILQGILRRFQKGLAVREAAELAGRGQDSGIDQVRKNGMEIVSKSSLSSIKSCIACTTGCMTSRRGT